MPLTWIEDGDSRQATIVRKGKKGASSYTKSYKIFGTADDTELHAAINAEISANGAYWQYPGVAGMQLLAEQYSVSYLGDNAWQLTISYEKAGAEDAAQPEPLKRARSFDTTGGTQHITQACSVPWTLRSGSRLAQPICRGLSALTQTASTAWTSSCRSCSGRKATTFPMRT
jgi:hypothetical protein